MVSRYATLGTRVQMKCSSRYHARWRPQWKASCAEPRPESTRAPMRVDGGTMATISKPTSRPGSTKVGGVRMPSVAAAHAMARTALIVDVRGFWYPSAASFGSVPSRRMAETRPTSAADAMTPKTSPVVRSSSGCMSSDVQSSALSGRVGRMGPGRRCFSQNARCSRVAAPRCTSTSAMRHWSSRAASREAVS